ncbi:MAG: thioesterase family protein [Trueperaceae bacterium]|nr:thioesterase family protein [Trueperaceae bacterium]
MTSDASPTEPTTNAHRTDIQVRFNDTDALGHINNTSFALYAEVARVEMLSWMRSAPVFLILAHIALDFRRQGRFDDEIYVLSYVEKLGRSSITLKQDIYAEDELAAEVRSVVVLFDYDAQQAVPLSDKQRGYLEAHRLEPSLGQTNA